MTLYRENSDLRKTRPPADWIDTFQQTLVGSRRIRELIATRLSRLDLSEPEFSLLWILAVTERRCGDSSPDQAISQREIARQLAISAAQVCGLVERMRQRELICSKRDPSDRRRQCWRLTDRGAAMFRSATERLTDWTDRCDGEIAPEEKVALDRSLTVIEQITRQSIMLQITHEEDTTETEFRSGKAA